MKIIIYIYIILLLGCRTNCEYINNPYDLNLYYRVKSKSSNELINKEIFLACFDESWKYLKKYWENGNIQGECFMHNEIVNGIFKLYNIEGKIILEGMYVNGLKTGLFKYYSGKGDTIYKEVFYKNDSLIRELIYE